MQNFLRFTLYFISASLSAIAFAQSVPRIVISPAAPSSADSITIQIDHGLIPPVWVADSYRVSQQGNRVLVTYGTATSIILPGVPPPVAPGFQYTNIDLGKFPAGNYTVDVVSAQSGPLTSPVATGIPLVVTDARALKTAPYVQLNYADHWWNPAESGWGLFIWHDKLDRLLATWFTYGSDNKADWYTIQGGRWVSRIQYDGQLFKTTGPSFANFVPGSAVQTQAVGSASLYFTDANNGTFTYTLGGVTRTKAVTRFKP